MKASLLTGAVCAISLTVAACGGTASTATPERPPTLPPAPTATPTTTRAPAATAAVATATAQAVQTVTGPISTAVASTPQPTTAPTRPPTSTSPPAATSTPAASGTLTAIGTLRGISTSDFSINMTSNAGADIQLRAGIDRKYVLNGTFAKGIGALTQSTGQPAAALYDAATKTVVQIQVGAPIGGLLSGSLKAVNLQNSTLTVTNTAAREVVVPVAPNTKITVDGAVAQLDSLRDRLGSPIDVAYDLTTTTAYVVDLPAPQTLSVLMNATLSDVNPVGNTLTVINPAGGGNLVLQVPPYAFILVDGAVTDLRSLTGKVNSLVTLQYSLATIFLAAIIAPAPAPALGSNALVAGTLTSMDPRLSTILVTSQLGPKLILYVTRDTKITLGGVPVPYGALQGKLNATLNVRYNPQTQSAMSITD